MNAEERKKLAITVERFYVRRFGESRFWANDGHGYSETKEGASKFTMERIKTFNTYKRGELEIIPV